MSVPVASSEADAEGDLQNFALFSYVRERAVDPCGAMDPDATHAMPGLFPVEDAEIFRFLHVIYLRVQVHDCRRWIPAQHQDVVPVGHDGPDAEPCGLRVPGFCHQGYQARNRTTRR